MVWRNNPLPFHQNAAAGRRGAPWPPTSRASSGRCTTSCSRTSRRSTRPTSRSTRRRSASTSTSSRRRSTTSTRQGADQGRSGRGGQVRRARHAGVLHQRPPALGRAAVRRLQEGDRRGARATPTRRSRRASPAAQVYAALTKNGKAGAGRRPQPAQPQQPAQPDPNAVYKVPVGNSPEQGRRRPPRSPSSSSPTSSARSARASSRRSTELEKDYGKDVRVVWKNNPLPFHHNAMPAAEAAMAAREQGKFWEMHDKLFANQQHARSRRPREVRRGARPQHGQVQGGARRAQVQGARSRTTRRWPRSSARAARRRSSSTAASCAARSRSRRSRRSSTRRSRRPTRCSKSGVKPAELYAELIKDGKDKAEARAAPPQPQPGEPDADTRLQGDGRRRAGQGRQGRQGHHRRVLGLPVPVLRPRRADPRRR